jgi:hypothetical protein
MVDDIEEFKKLIKEKDIKTVDEMQRESLEAIKKIPNIQEKHEKATIARGSVLELSIILEIAFNELILKTGGEDFVIDGEKKELHIITGARKELGNLSFNKKAKLVKEIMEKTLDKPEDIPKPSRLEDFDKLIVIRDIFAHVPINWFSSELEFNDNYPYKHFFKQNPKWKNLSVALNDFVTIQKGIIELIPYYVRLILIKEKLIANVLFGDLKEPKK